MAIPFNDGNSKSLLGVRELLDEQLNQTFLEDK